MPIKIFGQPIEERDTATGTVVRDSAPADSDLGLWQRLADKTWIQIGTDRPGYGYDWDSLRKDYGELTYFGGPVAAHLAHTPPEPDVKLDYSPEGRTFCVQGRGAVRLIARADGSVHWR